MQLVTLTLSTPALKFLYRVTTAKMVEMRDLRNRNGHLPASTASWLESVANGNGAPTVSSPPAVMMSEGRAELVGRVLVKRRRATEFGVVFKLLVLLDTGVRCWVTCPEAREDDVERGSLVAFRGTVKMPKKGFDPADPFVVVTRPTNFRVNPAEAIFEQLERELTGFEAADFDAVIRNDIGDEYHGAWECGDVVVKRLVDATGRRMWVQVTNEDAGDLDAPDFVTKTLTVEAMFKTKR